MWSSKYFFKLNIKARRILEFLYRKISNFRMWCTFLFEIYLLLNNDNLCKEIREEPLILKFAKYNPFATNI